ncbi:hypothetical protein [Helicobacter pylori]|uniref:hypothetical protein n=1 Tax=Helicobacter pylori TaxID=210 RepID=UPI002FBE78E3
MCLLIKSSLFKKRGGFKKPLKLKIFKKQSLNPKKEILRYNAFAFAIFSFHSKLLFEDYPHKSNLWGSLFYNNLS